MNIVKILCAIFLPPVGAFLQVGVTMHFLINIVLTLLGGLPGVVHALWLVVTKKQADKGVTRHPFQSAADATVATRRGVPI